MWTRERPTEPGYYWYASGKEEPPEVVRVEHSGGRLVVEIIACDEFWEVGERDGFWQKVAPPSNGVS